MPLKRARLRPDVQQHFFWVRSANRRHFPVVNTIEIKRSTTPKVERGFYSACEDIQPSRKWLIYSGSECYPLVGGMEVMSLHGAMQALA
jgi:hypothetical protein